MLHTFARFLLLYHLYMHMYTPTAFPTHPPERFVSKHTVWLAAGVLQEPNACGLSAPRGRAACRRGAVRHRYCDATARG